MLELKEMYNALIEIEQNKDLTDKEKNHKKNLIESKFEKYLISNYAKEIPIMLTNIIWESCHSLLQEYYKEEPLVLKNNLHEIEYLYSAFALLMQVSFVFRYEPESALVAEDKKELNALETETSIESLMTHSLAYKHSLKESKNKELNIHSAKKISEDLQEINHQFKNFLQSKYGTELENCISGNIHMMNYLWCKLHDEKNNKEFLTSSYSQIELKYKYYALIVDKAMTYMYMNYEYTLKQDKLT